MKKQKAKLTLLISILIFTIIISCSLADGTKYITSLSTNGAIEPTGYLSLKHNLNRNDLTFTGQFLKNGYIYDYNEYKNLFSDDSKVIIKNPVIFNNAGTIVISATTLDNGNFAIAYRDANNSNYGTFIILDNEGNTVVSSKVFEQAATTYISATALTNGKALIAYRDVGNSNHGTFVIVDGAGSTIIGPTEFSGNSTLFRSIFPVPSSET